jgi:hypothetical protein
VQRVLPRRKSGRLDQVPDPLVVSGMSACITLLENGTDLGGHRIDGVAGQGGMGVV